MFDLTKISLPKWSCLTVVGSKVTRDQAAEILIRTDDWYFSSNDQDLVKELMTAAGVKSEKVYHGPSTDSLETARKKYRVLALEYLHNSRVVSAYIDGPHGWCDWDGTIFCNSYNIGKWPHAEQVFDEWQEIAAAFPYLQLHSQLYGCESLEEGKPVIEFILENGNVVARDPSFELIPRQGTADWEKATVNMILVPARIREFGCTLTQYKEALKIAKGETNETASKN